MRFITVVLAVATAVVAGVAAGPGCEDGAGADAGGDVEAGVDGVADVDAGDACGSHAWTLCRGSVMDGRCAADYDPGCPPCLPDAGTPCSGSLHCDYCRGGWFDPSGWNTTSCRGGLWGVWSTHCDPPPRDADAEADTDAGADAEVDDTDAELDDAETLEGGDDVDEGSDETETDSGYDGISRGFGECDPSSRDRVDRMGCVDRTDREHRVGAVSCAIDLSAWNSGGTGRPLAAGRVKSTGPRAGSWC